MSICQKVGETGTVTVGDQTLDFEIVQGVDSIPVGSLVLRGPQAGHDWLEEHTVETVRRVGVWGDRGNTFVITSGNTGKTEEEREDQAPMGSWSRMCFAKVTSPVAC